MRRGTPDEERLEALQARPPVRIKPPPSLAEDVKRQILRMSQAFPTWGCKTISWRLKQKGKPASHTKVQEVLSQNGRATRKERGVVKGKSANEKPEKAKKLLKKVSERNQFFEQVAKTKAKLVAGESLFQNLYPAKLPAPLKNCYFQEIVDLRGSFGFVDVHQSNVSSNAVDLLQRTTKWYQKELGVNVRSIKTPERYPYTKDVRHSYTEYKDFLDHNQIKHSLFKGGFSLEDRVAQAFHRMLLSQFLNKLPTGKLKKTSDVQKVLDTWLQRYNREPNDLNGGKSPWEMIMTKPK